MIIIGKEGCPKCKSLRINFPDLKYIQIPKLHIGFGDTICAITCMLGIHPCGSCRIRQYKCNKWIPYKWNIKKLSPEIIALKQKILSSKVKEFPIIMDDKLEYVIPIENLYNNRST